MKIRSGYVSNSSSSSFILKETPAIAGLKSQDWNTMIAELYPDYERRVESSRKMAEENGWEVDEHPVFSAFDLKTEKPAAEKELKSLLEGWHATGCRKVNGVVVQCESSPHDEFVETCAQVEQEALHNILARTDYGAECIRVNIWPYCNSKDEIRDENNDAVTIWKYDLAVREPLPEKYVRMLERKWDELGVCTNADVLESPLARFVVHFDENEYCDLNGVSSKEGWETEEYTYERLCEVFAKWLKEHGKVPETFTWHDLVDATLTVNMHEG